MTPHFRRVLKAIVLGLSFVILAGATYQGVATALERRQFPYPGRLVDVGGHQLHLYCIGEGAPTVVLEAPAAALSAAWGWVQPELAMGTRVCSYDRSGLGWSEAGSGRFDAEAVPAELHLLLMNAPERGPYVVVGQGLGAAFARLFGSRFPSDTAALVLIDAPDAMRENGRPQNITTLVRVSPWLARTGVLRATRVFAGRAVGLPDESAGRMQAFLHRPDHLTRAGQELAAWDRVVDLARAAKPTRHEVVEVQIDANDRVGLLNEREEASRATAAIKAAIANVHRRP